MDKSNTSIVTLAVVFMIAILLIAILCNNSKTKEETIVNQYDYTIKDTVEVIRIAPFLKNTTYMEIKLLLQIVIIPHHKSMN